ncbi:STAS domain-containing protein [Actinocrispum wychmicini]|uniref:Anti-sigma factor antagonist n=1 Tax=Actinocrispum wychmicini TaxID=1213861 RepID=A0A4V2S3Q2_9PSEU|nr:STAS domain-containing protein [Actinocrispum wychmicini]TCO45350.1 anti-anti-sigma factor [Actinocrispum wychmicini]
MTSRRYGRGSSPEITVDRSGPVVVARVTGEIDLATKDEFQRGIDGVLAGGPDAVVIDLSDVGFMGSLGLAVLVQANHQAQDRGMGFYLVTSSNTAIARLLEITGLTNSFQVAASVQQALRDAVDVAED